MGARPGSGVGGPPTAGGDPVITAERPALLVTTEIPPDRVGAFRALADRIPVELALFGGGLHATEGVRDHGLPVREVSQREIYGLASSGRYSVVAAGTAGRLALPGAWLGAERAHVPFVLWTALWAHPRSAAHLPGALLLRLLYRRAAAVVTYGPHVSRLAQAGGARDVVVAPQAVDQAFWAAPAEPGAPRAPSSDSGPSTGSSPDSGSSPDFDPSTAPRLVYVGRDDPGKGVDWLLAAWRASGLGEAGAAELRLIGPAPARAAGIPGVVALGPQPPERVREELRTAAGAVVPSERTATFREPWGLVVNEAMHSGALVIASTEVGAVAGGLVQPERTGLVVPAGNVNALAGALRRAAGPQGPAERAIRAAGQQAASSYTQTAWAAAFASALSRSVASRP